MKPDKPRHNPDKKQNKYGTHCPFDDGIMCELYLNKEILNHCKGNLHNCRSACIKMAHKDPLFQKYLNDDYDRHEHK